MSSIYPMTNTEILVFDGVDELDAVAPFEILVAAGYQVELVTIEPRSAVNGSHGMTITPTGVLGRPDLLVVTGGGWSTRSRDSAWGEVQRGVIPSAIRGSARVGHPHRRSLHRRHVDRGRRHPSRQACGHSPLRAPGSR